MKEVSELVLPEDVRYAKDHEWAKIEGDRVTIGISDFAQDQLGDVVFVELPKVGDTFSAGVAFGTVESVKAVNELFMPLGGKIEEVNATLADSPELVNTSPYQDGWMIRIQPGNLAEMDSLMTRDDYLNMLGKRED
jgi:glycine cleavage system H protein